MKAINYFILLVFILVGCNAQNGFELSGTIENGKGRIIYLDMLGVSSLIPVDSIILSDDESFRFKNELTIPTFFLLRESQRNFITLLINPGEKVTVTADMDNLGDSYVIEGSDDSKLIQDYNLYLKQNLEKLQALNKIYTDSLNSPNIAAITSDLDERSNRILEDQRDYTIRYISENSRSLVSLLALYQQVSPRNYVLNPTEDIQYFEMVDSILYELFPESEPVQALHAQVMELKQRIEAEQMRELRFGEGAIPPEIALPNPAGDTILLSSTRGKIVLLDFWAAWCNPCRLENPNLVENYQKYHAQGFEIFQVSLDRDRDAWLNAIESDGLGEWIHVSDLMFWNSIVTNLYQLTQIPTNFLLDREGKIIARDLRGENLGRKLSELFD
jgi:peroxiredoxin